MRPASAVKRPHVSRMRRDQLSHKPSAPSYDELVLQWAMSATPITAAERSDVLARAADNRRATLPLVHSSAHEIPTDELLEEMEICIHTLRSQSGSELMIAAELRRPAEDARRLLARDIKLELCYRQQSESIFQVNAVWEELRRQSLHWASLEVLEEVSWQPTSPQAGSVCSYMAFGLQSVVFVRIHDVLTFDAAGQVQLIVRTMLLHPDDAARGRNARWSPPFGTLSKLTPLA
jgi:hypothetical protein